MRKLMSSVRLLMFACVLISAQVMPSLAICPADRFTDLCIMLEQLEAVQVQLDRVIEVSEVQRDKITQTLATCVDCTSEQRFTLLERRVELEQRIVEARNGLITLREQVCDLKRRLAHLSETPQLVGPNCPFVPSQ
jgi:hypothetical protein